MAWPRFAEREVQFTAFVAAMLGLGLCCAHEYVYAPVASAARGGPVGYYLVPPNAPRGEVYVTSFGFTELQIGPARTATVLHLRLAVSNGGATPWTVAGPAQRAVAAAEEPQGPTFLNTNAGQGPIYQVLPGRANVFDLYYALAPPLDPQSVGGFALDWSIDAGGQIVADRTWCLRYEAGPISYAPYPPYVAVELGFGAAWWHDPSFFYPIRRAPEVRDYYFPPASVRAGPSHGGPLAAWPATPPASATLRGAHAAVTTSPLRAAPVPRPSVPRRGMRWYNEGLSFRGGR